MRLLSTIVNWFTGRRGSLSAGARRLRSLVVANRRVTVGLALGVLVALSGVIGYLVWGSKREVNAAVLLFKAQNQMAVNTGSPEDVKVREQAVQMMRDVSTRYPRSAAGAEATLRLGNLYYTLEKYDEARKVYQDYLIKNPSGRIAFAAGIGVGDTYLAQRKYDKAVEIYSGLMNRFPLEPLLPEVYLNLAITHLNMKRTQEAVRLYEKVVEGYPGTGWGQRAQAQLRKLRPRGAQSQ